MLLLGPQDLKPQQQQPESDLFTVHEKTETPSSYTVGKMSQKMQKSL